MSKIIYRISTLIFILFSISCGNTNTNQTKKVEPIMSKIPFFIGSYTEAPSKGAGISWATLDTLSGQLEIVGHFSSKNPSYLTINKAGNRLYAVNELHNKNNIVGQVTAYTINPDNQQLNLLNTVTAGGNAACYISLTNDEKYILTANYTGGNVTSIPVLEDGSLSEVVHTIQHKGSGPFKERQEAPHPHFIQQLSNGDITVSDLGIDQLVHYTMTDEGLQIKDTTQVIPGSGPRHFVENIAQEKLYVLSELSNNVEVFDMQNGRPFRVQVVPTSEQDLGYHVCKAAAIKQHPKLPFLYASNRGSSADGGSTIALFEIGEDGLLSFIETKSTNGLNPRDFSIDPTGRFLLAANQDSENIVVFTINQDTGQLNPTEHTLKVKHAVCVRFY